MTKKHWSTLLTILTIAALVLVVISLTGIMFPQSRVITPKIDPVMTGQPPIPVTSSFPFQKGTATISIIVNGSVFEGARNADKSVTIIGNISDSVWVEKSYRAMVDDSAQDRVFEDLIGQFRKIRAQQSLSDDEYLELMAVYVQSLRYETIDNNTAKFPVETVVDSAGDCDDKSLLLAGLLSREGYRVALLSFGPENHMALGIGSDDYQYDTTNYTFLETTNLSYVGVPTENLGADKKLASSPIVIPLGKGEKCYSSAGQTQLIHETAAVTELKVKELEPQVKALYTDLNQRKQELLELEKRMQTLRSGGNIREYNELVSTHNAKVSEYNKKLEAYQETFSRYEKNALIHNYIIDHQYDRLGVYEYIKKNLP